MRKAFWFGCMGMVMAAGIVYLAASRAQKPQARTLGHQAAAPASHSNRLRELACCPESVSGITCVHAEEAATPPNMPPQIIDVCQEQPFQHWTLGGAIHHHPELIQTGLEIDTVSIDDAEAIGMPQEETIEELGMPQEEPCEELGMPMEIDEDFCPMPCIINEEESVEPTACEQGDDPFVSFWLSLFKDVMPGADDEECEPASDEDACEEDPHHPEHYPHCPYMGGCPRGSPSCPATASPRTRTPHDEECEPCPKAEPDPESPAQPGVDTMEFRPEDDAKEGEFESKPM